MRERELSELEIGAAFQAFLEDAPTEVQPAVLVDQLVRVHQADRQTRRWWSVFVSRPSWSPALRVAWLLALVAVLLAAAVAAVFVGSELLRRPDDLSVVVPVPGSPSPVPASPSPMTTEELPSGILTEEVEPGVFRVTSDGESDLAYPVDSHIPNDIVAGHDGGIYVLDPVGYARLGPGLGRPDGFDWRLVAAFPPDVEVTSDGTIWAVLDGHLYSTPRGSELETRHLTTTSRGPVEVTSDGTVWAVWLDDSGNAVFGYLGADGWTMVGEWPFEFGDLRVSDQGDVWAVECGWGFCLLHRFIDGAWREAEVSRQHGALDLFHVDVGADGTFWGHYREEGDFRLIRFDGTEWTTFEPPGWSRTDVSMKDVADAEGGFQHGPGLSLWGEPHVAADGSLWVPSRLGEIGINLDLVIGNRIVCGDGIDGVARFDGETWSRFLQGRCVEAMDIAPDGSVWLLAKESDARSPVAHLYVITPEAVAASD